jgi:type IV pilus assembly protein PilC
MFDAGVPLFAVFEFLAREGESRQVAEACRRIAQRLVSGISLSAAAQEEPELFDQKSVRMLEVGYRGGQLSSILQQLAGDEEHAWRTLQHLRTQLTYPFGIALLTLLAVVLMPPLVLNDLLQQVVALTAQPPALTLLLLNISGVLASPWTWTTLVFLTLGGTLWLRSPRGQTVVDNLEVGLWFVPAVGPLWRNLVAMRFMRVFAMTYRAGLPALTGMELATAATGSRMAYTVYPLMKRTLLDGGTLKESFEAGGFLPTLALEAIAAGETAGKVPTMLESASKILESELQSRVDAVAKLVEPIVLAFLGCVVGVFVLGCLLPIVELTANL